MKSAPEKAIPTNTNRRTGSAPLKVLVGAVLGVAALLGALLLYCIAMPGDSFRGTAPRLTEAETKLAAELRRHVGALAVDIGQRRAVSGDSLKRAEAYIHDELAKSAPGAKLQREKLENAPGDPANVILELPGKQPGPIVIVGAHYDTAPGGTPGANDNGSGTAAALVLAEQLSLGSRALPIRIVFFANEELPYFRTQAMGSLQHAAGCRKRGEEIRAMLSLETMGYFSDEPGSQKYPASLSLFYPDRGNFIGFVGNLGSRSLLREVLGGFRAHSKIPSEGAALPESLPGVSWSDHWSFWQHGYSAVMVTDTALFRDPTYHRTSDIASNLDYERLARVVAGLQKTIEALASQ